MSKQTSEDKYWKDLLSTRRNNDMELEKWANKYKLWKILHWDNGENCYPCMWYNAKTAKRNCPIFVLSRLSETEFYNANINCIDRRFCKEWIKHV